MGKQHPVHIKYPIDLKKNEIRLLEILPGLWSDIVQCEFRIVSLDDNPSYAALSYAWGDAPPEFDITINSYPIKIRPNLFAALRRFRAFSTQKYSVIWADAVCIDQAFTLERNHQVSMMGTIYSKCQEVLIWMGDMLHESYRTERDPHESEQEKSAVHQHEQCLDMTEDSGSAIQECKDFMLTNWTAMADCKYQCLTPSHIVILGACLTFMMSSGCHLNEVSDLFERMGPVSWSKIKNRKESISFALRLIKGNMWFHRLWVIQEAVLAPRAAVILDQVSLRLEAFSDAENQFKSHMDSNCCSYSESFRGFMISLGLSHYWTVFDEILSLRKEMGEQHKKSSLIDLRLYTGGRCASNDLDQVYALLGLTNQMGAMVPNYDLSPHQVYCTVSRDYIIGNSSLLPLSISKNQGRYPTTPSWAVDLTRCECDMAGPFNQLWVYNVLPNFDASRYLRGPGPTFQASSLLVNGLFTDCVQTIKMIRNWEFLSGGYVEKWSSTLLRNRSHLEAYPGNATCTLGQAWLRTLCVDHFQEAPSPSDTAYFKRKNLRRLRDDEVRLVSQGNNIFALPPHLSGNQSAPSLKEEQEYERALLGVEFMSDTLMSGAVRPWTMFFTSKGYLGIAHAEIAPADEIIIAVGGNMPLILRPTPNASSYRIISDCYLDGFMDGEHNERMQREQGGLKTFEIV